MAVVTQIQIRRGTAAQWTSTNPILASGEFGYETDTGKAKIGNGSSTWTALSYAITGTLGTVTSITAGTGLSGGTITNSGTIAIDSTVATLTGNQVLTNKTISGASNTLSNIGNSSLTNSSVTVNGTAISLGASGTVTVPISTGVTGLGTGVASALGTNVGSAGAPIVNGGALGTPSSGTLTNATGLPISTGVSGLAANVATFLGTPSSANLFAALTDETGTGLAVFGTSPTIVTPRVQYAINAQTGTSYTLAVSDANARWVTVDNAGTATVTVPPSVFSVGDVINVQRIGTGAVNFAQGAGVTITSTGATASAPSLRVRYSSATVICTASNVFTIVGDIS